MMRTCLYCGSAVSDDSAGTCPACGGTLQMLTAPPEARPSSPRKVFTQKLTGRRFYFAVIMVVALAVVISLASRRTNAGNSPKPSVNDPAAVVGESSTITELKAQAEERLASHDYEGILRAADRNREFFSKDETLYQAYEAAALGFQKQIVDEAKAAYRESGCSAALGAVNRGLSLMPDDPSLKYYYDLFVSCIPKDFGDLTILDEKGYNGYSVCSVTDPYGEEHTGGASHFIMDYFNGAASVTFVLNGKYSSLEASYFIDKYEAQICIYADEEKVYDSGAIDKLSGTKTLSLSVENVRLLRIETTSLSMISVFGDIDTSTVTFVDVKLERHLSDAELTS